MRWLKSLIALLLLPIFFLAAIAALAAMAGGDGLLGLCAIGILQSGLLLWIVFLLLREDAP